MFSPSRHATRLAFPLALWCAGCGASSGHNTDVTIAPSDTRDGADTVALPPVVATRTALRAVPVTHYLMAVATTPESDTVGTALEYGSFVPPSEPGQDTWGVTWAAVVPNANGAFTDLPPVPVYVIARVEVTETTRVAARLDRARGAWLGRRVVPGDIYGHVGARVPLVLTPGTHDIVIAGDGRLGNLRFRLDATPDEVWLNADDLTVATLVAGDDDPQWLGLPLVNLTGAPVRDLSLRAFGPGLETTEGALPFLAANATTQAGFLLQPSAPWELADVNTTVTVQVTSADLAFAYERTWVMDIGRSTVPYRRTFRSAVDGSVQRYGVRPPADPDPMRRYGLVLGLHGAGVEGASMAQSYSAHDWTWIVTPTNRRRYGFDWEEWGRLNALLTLEDAATALDADPRRIHLTGHSMGGHGTWHIGTMHPDRFASLFPSAGWRSFYSYVEAPLPGGPFARARAHSLTDDYLDNLEDKPIYILHGGDDTVVPPREGRDLFALMQARSDDLSYHEEPGKGHWWNGEAAAGVDCVDWPEAFALMKARTREPVALDFTFRSPGPHYSASYGGWLTLWSAADPGQDVTVSAATDGTGAVRLVTTNVRTLAIDGAVLRKAGVVRAVVGETEVALSDAVTVVGPTTGKRPGQQGTYNQVFHSPFAFVYDDADTAARDHAAYLVTLWSLVGNGRAQALPRSALTPAFAAEHNLVWVGVPSQTLSTPPTVPFGWGPTGVGITDGHWPHAALMMVWPRGEDRLDAYLYATPGSEHLLYRLVPFSSRAGFPDWLVLDSEGVRSAGFFDPDWGYRAELETRR